jgi:hypothetical protein
MALSFGRSVPFVQSTNIPSMSATLHARFSFSDNPVGPSTEMRKLNFQTKEDMIFSQTSLND